MNNFVLFDLIVLLNLINCLYNDEISNKILDDLNVLIVYIHLFVNDIILILNLLIFDQMNLYEY